MVSVEERIYCSVCPSMVCETQSSHAYISFGFFNRLTSALLSLTVMFLVAFKAYYLVFIIFIDINLTTEVLPFLIFGQFLCHPNL